MTKQIPSNKRDDVGILVNLKGAEWLRRQKIAGRVVSGVLRNFANMMKGEASMSIKDIEAMAKSYLDKADCEPTFFGYKGFPGVICASVNKEMVHGIPTDYRLKPGDIVTVDLGATFEGAIADAAFTAIYGKAKDPKHSEMLILCQKALNNAVDAIEVGKHLGVIGSTIHKTVKNSSFGLITDYGGHGIDEDTLHTVPFVANKCRETDGIIMRPGLSIAIEPMLVLGKNTNWRIQKDKWTVVTKELSCHFEHSVTIDTDGKVHIITEHLLDAADFI